MTLTKPELLVREARRIRRAAEAAVDLPGEIWVPVPGHPGYVISSLGRVKSLERTIDRKTGPQRLGTRILKGSFHTSGYRQVVVDAKRCFVHVLVLEAFVGPRPDGYHACHNNGDGKDNRIENLRWDTVAENNRDIVRHGRNFHANKTHCPYGHVLAEPNLVPAAWNRRFCLACKEARLHVNRMKTRGLVGDRDRIADAYYAEIMGTGPVVERLKSPVSTCPSAAGYWRHRYYGERPCPGCRAAATAYARNRKVQTGPDEPRVPQTEEVDE